MQRGRKIKSTLYIRRKPIIIVTAFQPWGESFSTSMISQEIKEEYSWRHV